VTDPYGLFCWLDAIYTSLVCGDSYGKILDLVIKNADRVQEECEWCKGFERMEQIGDKPCKKCEYYDNNFMFCAYARLDSIKNLPDNIKIDIQKYGEKCAKAITNLAFSCPNIFKK